MHRTLAQLSATGLLALAACGGAATTTNAATLEGTVRALDGTALTGIHATLDASSDTSTTDAAGTFLLHAGTNGPATLLLSRGGSTSSVAIPSLGNGVVVRVAVRLSDDGHHAELEHEAEAEVKGAITSIAAPDLVVAGRTVHTDAQTQFESGTLASLAVGQTVEVEGSLDAAGVLVAREIKLEDSSGTGGDDGDDHGGEQELQGRVDSKSGSDLTVAGHLVHTGASTVFDGHSADSLADIAVGATVEVRGTAQADGSISANRVHLDD